MDIPVYFGYTTLSPQKKPKELGMQILPKERYTPASTTPITGKAILR
jgi:hypothetical protein